jgi:hypothetical protein
LYTRLPRGAGGTNSGLIVVGNALEDGSRDPTSIYLDANNLGILTIYARGLAMCAIASDQNTWHLEPAGTSQATAQTAGLIAYYLSDPVLQSQWAQGGVRNIALNAKNFITGVATAQKGVWADGIPRASMPDTVPCTGQSNPGPIPIPPLVDPGDANYIGLVSSYNQVTQGTTLAHNPLVSCSGTSPS